MTGTGTNTTTTTTVGVKTKVKQPSMWKVVLHNDDYTPVGFVVALLQRVFNKSLEQAEEITMSVHNHGSGIAGSYPRDIASSKVNEADLLRKQHGHPLRVTMEKT